MELWVGAINLGFLYAFMTMGIFITFRIHDFPDITVDGSFTAGAAVSAVLIATGWNPLLALAAAFLTGAAAGWATAYIHTRLNINGLLAGILVMTGLYSINLHVMGRSNIPLLSHVTFVTYLEQTNPGLPLELWTMLILAPLMALFWLAVSLFFTTDLGISVRATGNNAAMAAATGINVDRMKTFGIAAANGLTGFAGGMVAQYQGFADVGMGIGTVVIGLAAVIMGESVVRTRSVYGKVLGVILGSVIFRLMIAFALSAGMNPIDLKLLTALFVLATLVLAKVVPHTNGTWKGLSRKALKPLSGKKRLLVKAAFAAAALGALSYGALHIRPAVEPLAKGPSKTWKIGVVQFVDFPILNMVRDGFLEELRQLGYVDGQNTRLLMRNANGDMPSINTIMDDLLRQNADMVVTLTTACTQSAVNKIKDRPIVFTAVSDPFIIGAGQSETNHLANIAGVYMLAPMDKIMEVVHQILPGKITIGTIWDPSQADSVREIEELEKAVNSYAGITLAGATIAGSSEVYQSAQSLAQQGIDAFVLVSDNLVSSAFQSVVKAARSKGIPIFTWDVDRLKDGAMVALGYDYTAAGIQAAHLVDRILKGESPGKLPFERSTKLALGVNADVAAELKIAIPPDVVDRADMIHGNRSRLSAPGQPGSVTGRQEQ